MTKKMVIVGPYNVGSSSAGILTYADTYIEAMSDIRHDVAYWRKFGDVVGAQYAIYSATDVVDAETHLVDGYPLRLATVGPREGIHWEHT